MNYQEKVAWLGRYQTADDLAINIKTPAEIKEGLDQYVIGQDEAKRWNISKMRRKGWRGSWMAAWRPGWR